MTVKRRGMAVVLPVSTQADFDSARDLLQLQQNPQEFRNMNRLLNACDSWKDAINATTSISARNRLFDRVIGNLYGAIPGSWKLIKDRIIQQILENPAYGNTTPMKVCWVEAMSQADLKRATRPVLAENFASVTKIPESVRFATHDSGYNPLDVSPNVSLLLTPGSYIDPAKRSKVGDLRVLGCIGQSCTIDSFAFAAMGFGNAILSFTATLEVVNGIPTGNMICDIEMPGNIQVRAIRSQSHEHVSVSVTLNENLVAGTNIDFFGGNPTKNAWFNIKANEAHVFNGVDLNSIIALLYALFKELGDTLQVLYIYMCFRGQLNPSVCMFTTDDVVLARCRELMIACCCQDHSIKEYENLGRTNYWTPHYDAAALGEATKGIYKQRCLEENVKTITSINTILGHGFFIMNGKEYEMIIDDDDPTVIFLKGIIENIQAKQLLLDPIGKEVGEYHKECLEATAVKIVDCKKILTSVRSLYKTPAGTADPIRGTGRSLGEELYRLNSARDRGKRMNAAPRGSMRQRDNPLPARTRFPRILANPRGLRMVEQQGGNSVKYIKEGGGDRGIPINDFMQDFYEMIESIARDSIPDQAYPYEKAYGRLGVGAGAYSIATQEDYNDYIEDVSYDFLCIMSIYLNYVNYSCLHYGILSVFFRKFIIEGLDADLDSFRNVFMSNPDIILDLEADEVKKLYGTFLITGNLRDKDNCQAKISSIIGRYDNNTVEFMLGELDLGFLLREREVALIIEPENVNLEPRVKRIARGGYTKRKSRKGRKTHRKPHRKSKRKTNKK